MAPFQTSEGGGYADERQRAFNREMLRRKKKKEKSGRGGLSEQGKRNKISRLERRYGLDPSGLTWEQRANNVRTMNERNTYVIGHGQKAKDLGMDGELHPFNKAEDTAQGAKLTYKHIPDLIKPKPPQPQQQSFVPGAGGFGDQGPPTPDNYFVPGAGGAGDQGPPLPPGYTPPQPQPQQAPKQQLDLRAIEHMNANRAAIGLPPLNFSTDKGFTQGAMPQSQAGPALGSMVTDPTGLATTRQEPLAQEVPQALSQEVQRMRRPEVSPEEKPIEGIFRGAREALLPGYGQTAKDTGSVGEGIKEGIANRLAVISPALNSLLHGLGVTEGKGSLLSKEKVTGESSVEERKKRFEQLTALTNEEKESLGITPELMKELQEDILSQESRESGYFDWEAIGNLYKGGLKHTPGPLGDITRLISAIQGDDIKAAKEMAKDPWGTVGSILEQAAEAVIGGAAARTGAAARLPGVGKYLGPKNVPSAKDLWGKIKEIPSQTKATNKAAKEKAKQKVTKANQKEIARRSWEAEGKRIKAERQARKDAEEKKAQQAKWEKEKPQRNKAHFKRGDKIAEKKRAREEEKLNKRKSEVEKTLKDVDEQIAQKSNSKNWSQYDPEEVAALNKKKISLEGELKDLKAGRQRIPWDKGAREAFLERSARRITNPTRDFGIQRKRTKITKVVENKSEGQRAADKIKAETKGMTTEQKIQHLFDKGQKNLTRREEAFINSERKRLKAETKGMTPEQRSKYLADKGQRNLDRRGMTPEQRAADKIKAETKGMTSEQKIKHLLSRGQRILTRREKNLNKPVTPKATTPKPPRKSPVEAAKEHKARSQEAGVRGRLHQWKPKTDKTTGQITNRTVRYKAKDGKWYQGEVESTSGGKVTVKYSLRVGDRRPTGSGRHANIDAKDVYALDTKAHGAKVGDEVRLHGFPTSDTAKIVKIHPDGRVDILETGGHSKRGMTIKPGQFSLSSTKSKGSVMPSGVGPKKPDFKIDKKDLSPQGAAVQDALSSKITVKSVKKLKNPMLSNTHSTSQGITRASSKSWLDRDYGHKFTRKNNVFHRLMTSKNYKRAHAVAKEMQSQISNPFDLKWTIKRMQALIAGGKKGTAHKVGKEARLWDKKFLEGNIPDEQVRTIQEITKTLTGEGPKITVKPKEKTKKKTPTKFPNSRLEIIADLEERILKLNAKGTVKAAKQASKLLKDKKVLIKQERDHRIRVKEIKGKK